MPDRPQEDFDFIERLEKLNEELEVLNSEARELEDRIAENGGGSYLREKCDEKKRAV